MQYHSTRGGVTGYSFEAAVMEGLAPDGGLFIPSHIPSLPADWTTAWAELTFQELAVQIFRLFIDEAEIPTPDLEALVRKSYETFRTPEVAPVRPLGDPCQQRWILELFHGPTFAFKDVALQFLGNVFEYFLERRNQQDTSRRHFLTVVGATSGDTGSAAIYGLRNKKNIQAFILHPQGRVSPIQEAQMTTVLDPNIHNLAVQGTFDDCQAIVKALFGNPTFRKRYHLGAINSINWARILAQTVYYFYSYFSLRRQLRAQGQILPDSVVYTVPSGNFGDVLAGYYARQLGLPVRRLVVATNANDILYRFFTTGRYEKSTVVEADGTSVKATYSPAMDILISSNFERLLWYLAQDHVATGTSGTERANQAGQIVKKWMDEFQSTGRLAVNEAALQAVREIFDTAAVSDADTLSTINQYYYTQSADKSYLLDPHTAVGVKAADRVTQRSPQTYANVPNICLSTAHPAKFSEAVSKALHVPQNETNSQVASFDFDQVLPPEFVNLLEKPRRCLNIQPGTVENIQATIVKTLGSTNL
ncbi:threonine synthase [Dispira parvispora]|uniref:threonine synthase n=1 Tax=Dispira parvispora TaxID=1520584 RepID=A0A9W8AKV7_9FUNG|nr:threonine synthase [Dispira parvispora]